MDFGFCGMKRKITPPAGFFAGVRVVVVSCYYMPRDDPIGGWHSCERSLRLNRLFGCFPHPLYGGGMTLPVCGNYSAMQ